MKFTRTWELRCDSILSENTPPECEQVANHGLSRAEAIQEAREQGWYIRGSAALCSMDMIGWDVAREAIAKETR